MRMVITLVSLLLVFACDPGPVDPGGLLRVDSLRGSWRWVYSQGGITGTDVWSSASKGYEQTVAIGDGSLRWFLDDSLAVDAGLYVVPDTSASLYGLPVLILHDMNWGATAPSPLSWCRGGGPLCLLAEYEFRGWDTLLLHDPCLDCYAHRFIRIAF